MSARGMLLERIEPMFAEKGLDLALVARRTQTFTGHDLRRRAPASSRDRLCHLGRRDRGRRRASVRASACLPAPCRTGDHGASARPPAAHAAWVAAAFVEASCSRSHAMGGCAVQLRSRCYALLLHGTPCRVGGAARGQPKHSDLLSVVGPVVPSNKARDKAVPPRGTETLRNLAPSSARKVGPCEDSPHKRCDGLGSERWGGRAQAPLGVSCKKRRRIRHSHIDLSGGRRTHNAPRACDGMLPIVWGPAALGLGWADVDPRTAVGQPRARKRLALGQMWGTSQRTTPSRTIGSPLAESHVRCRSTTTARS